MPTYDYECAACGHRLEVFQSMTSPVLRKCPACKKAKLQRLIGAGAGVIFKGTGFYQTDYKKTGKGGGDEKKGEGEKKSDGEKGKEGSAKEAKPATSKSEGGDSKAAEPTPKKSEKADKKA